MTSAVLSLPRRSACQLVRAADRPDAATDRPLTRSSVPRQGECVVSKSVQFLHKDNVSRDAPSPVAEAARWARALYQREKARLRFACDDADDAAISHVARRAQAPRSKIHSLVRRPQILKDISAGIYLRLAALYHAECQRQIEALTHEIAITAALAGADHPDVRAAEALVGPPARATEVSS